ncbi:uncharacterized protein LOC141813603 [Curcuma longa]|uniref:uncharacterized protein LOC141813603 n=1 Tax=Curcuma longa TaxID=136217 RepID=UPI003D9F271E
MKKYGLQLRVPPANKTSKPPPARPPPPAFGFGDDDEDDVEREISRQASKNKALQKIEEQHKQAMEEDPSVFDYDGVYDTMKEQAARPKIQDRTERKSKYIETLMEKAKQREREHEVVYERKLLKERSKEDHLYADKEKFVTGAYKKKLAEQAKWLEEERQLKIREEREDVTKKSDLSDFYFGLGKNVAFGAQSAGTTKMHEREPANDISKQADYSPTETSASRDNSKNREQDGTQAESSSHSPDESKKVAADHASEQSTALDGKNEPAAPVTNNEQYKRSEDAVAAARERYLARKRARVQI